VHQPTLIDNASVQLRLVRDGEPASRTTNRTDDEGLAELVAGATEVVASASPTRISRRSLRPPSSRRRAATTTRRPRSAPTTRRAWPRRAIAASGDYGLYGFFTSGVIELAIASTPACAHRSGRPTRTGSPWPRSTAHPATRRAPRGASATWTRPKLPRRQ
jgi:hypothetical protein